MDTWRLTEGVEPDAVKAASPVLNGGDKETGSKENPRLVPTQLKRPLGWRVPLWFLVLCSAAFLGARTVAAEAAVTHLPVLL